MGFPGLYHYLFAFPLVICDRQLLYVCFPKYYVLYAATEGWLPMHVSTWGCLCFLWLFVTGCRCVGFPSWETRNVIRNRPLLDVFLLRPCF